MRKTLKKPYIKNIEKATKANFSFRKVSYTAPKLQLVLMSLLPKQEIGEEIHNTVDQFFRIEKGTGIVRIKDKIYKIKSGDAILIPRGTLHNIINTGTVPLKLYTLYSSKMH